MKHVTVLKTEAVDALNLKSDSVVVDCTFGAGGHAREILEHLGKDGTYVGIDADSSAFTEEVLAELEQYPATVHPVVDNFRNIGDVLQSLGIEEVDAILADFGWRTDQFMAGNKGFSFTDESLPLMTYGDPSQYTFTAHEIINEWDEENIADIIYGYGEERGSRRIAKAIVEAREHAEITTSAELAQIVTDALPAFLQKKRIHPATKTFQALRIAVNDELKAIEALILNGFDHLKVGGRMSLITFHSLEDRLVKQQFASYVRDQHGELVFKKPLQPTPEEINHNPRARSAKLRAIEKV